MKKITPPVRWFLLLLGIGLMLWAGPLVYSGWRDGFAIYLLFTYVAAPVLSLAVPFFGGTRGLHPMAAFFPIGTAVLFSTVGDHGGMAIGMMLVALISCVAGNEVKKRREAKEGTHCGRR